MTPTDKKNYTQQDMPLLSALKHYASQDIAPFDVPGHKRGRGVPVLGEYFGRELMAMDVNSLPALDNAGHPTGVIKAAQALMADAYGADAAFFMTNGTTSAIHAMLMAVINQGDTVLLPRNIHKSAINGLILCGGVPLYIDAPFIPSRGITANVTPEQIRDMLTLHPHIKAVFLLNPTYYGMTADLRAIADICHERGVLLLVDEAHGAHLPFHPDLPVSGMEAGADMACTSIHKTGGALTQASVLLVKRKRVSINRVQQVINVLQSTSCSYLLMGSLDGARYNLVQHGQSQLGEALRLADYARQQLNQLSSINTIDDCGSPALFDRTKLGITVSGLGLTGFDVYDIMHERYGIQLELADLNNVLAIISLGDTQQAIDRLVSAFTELAAEHEGKERATPIVDSLTQMTPPVVKLSPREAFYADKHLIPLADSVGRICGESIMAYPPGIPIIAPGEVITQQVVRVLHTLQASNAFLTDNYDPSLTQVLVIKEDTSC